MLEKTILEYGRLKVKVTNKANEGILDILNHAVQGSEGGMRFQLQNIEKKIKAYGDQIRFVSLYKRDKITGTIGACFRMSGQGALSFPSTYIRYFAFQSVYRSDIRWKKRDREQIRQEPDDSFKRKTLDIFSKPHLLELPHVFEAGKHIMYAFIESMNERSKNLVIQAGYEHIRSFLTVTFSRFNPKPDTRVSKLQDADKQRMKELLLDFYRDYSFFSTDFIFYDDRYYVLRDGDEIIAGVCAIPSAYKVYNIPGIWGWVIMKVLPKVPYFRKLFSPDEFKFLVFDAIYFKKGREDVLPDLFESVCAVEGFNTGLMWLDDRSTLYDKIRSGRRMGALNRMLNAKPGLVFTKFVNFPDEAKDIFYDVPAYISGFDFT
ncbi:MAG TPA: hypothetical protein PLI41_04920 [Bacteroidales bacterium]|jgi:hypothetical protein|nr:hypothetical protein [Bacteroidales bacterium]HQB36872.1 hypothetical protein [Bacteroidales bacterium]